VHSLIVSSFRTKKYSNKFKTQTWRFRFSSSSVSLLRCLLLSWSFWNSFPILSFFLPPVPQIYFFPLLISSCCHVNFFPFPPFPFSPFSPFSFNWNQTNNVLSNGYEHVSVFCNWMGRSSLETLNRLVYHSQQRKKKKKNKNKKKTDNKNKQQKKKGIDRDLDSNSF